MTHPSDIEAIKPRPTDAALVRALCNIDHGLSAWEVNFIESIAKLVEDSGLPLSEKQRAKAEKILQEKG